MIFCHPKITIDTTIDFYLFIYFIVLIFFKKKTQNQTPTHLHGFVSCVMG
jgi:hypothetical protein